MLCMHNPHSKTHASMFLFPLFLSPGGRLLRPGGRLHVERPAGRAGARLPVALGAADSAGPAVLGGSHQWLGAGRWN